MNVIPSIRTADRYVAYLDRVIRTDPGRRAALRRGLGRPVDDALVRRSHAVVARWLPVDRPGRAVESAYYTVAALIAAQPARRQEPEPLPTAEAESVDPPIASEKQEEAERPTTSLGGTLGVAVRDDKLNPTSVEERLHLLCRQDISGLHRHLPGLVRQLAAKEMAPDWGRLLVDLSGWGHRRDQIGKWWLQDFYRATNPVTTTSATDNDAEGEDQ
ncbi:type I-E CRISPR-associated protein Cse2/CasB [Planomonospora corallina]|uniref:Type I-E CRISPR-associated protein Cse2/CasB n=1 Tax=Planomonospora corallina TaxID=1806052 RepID=A0ABV8I358_9ACTN